MICFDRKYWYAALLLLLIEVLIALYVHDHIVRPYIGDLLAVVLVYCLLKSFLRFSVFAAACVALLVAFVLETMQYFEVLQQLGLDKSRLLRTVLGTAFSWADMGWYSAGFIAILVGEKLLRANPIATTQAHQHN
jgi:hypothetical protein